MGGGHGLLEDCLTRRWTDESASGHSNHRYGRGGRGPGSGHHRLESLRASKRTERRGDPTADRVDPPGLRAKEAAGWSEGAWLPAESRPDGSAAVGRIRAAPGPWVLRPQPHPVRNVTTSRVPAPALPPTDSNDPVERCGPPASSCPASAP